jgi:thiol-disulfide isomerase/thioredoxin
MKFRERVLQYMRNRSPLRLTTDLLFYLLILSLLLPFSRKYVATSLNKVIMHRPGIIGASDQVSLTEGDYDWKLMDMNGKSISFREFRGDLIFLNFWATWCPPCRAEMPNIQRLYERYGDRVSFVLTSQEPPGTILRYMEDHGYSMPVYRLVQNPPARLSTAGIPTTFLITPAGKITVRKTGAARWDGRYFIHYLDGMLER